MKSFLSIITIVISLSLNAQTLSIGPVAGFGHSYLSMEDDNGPGNKFFPAWNAGVKLVYSIVSHWGISVDLKLSGEGGKTENVVLGDTYTFKYRANYVRLPIQGVYFFGKLGDPVRPKLSFGPSLGFLVGGKTKVSISNDPATGSFDTKDLFDGFDFGLNGAAGANIRLKGDKWLNTDITYYHGLSNASASVSSIKNRSIGINVGLTFPIGN